MNVPLTTPYDGSPYNKLSDKTDKLFSDKTIITDLSDFSLSLYNHEIKDMREINDMIAFYGNMLLSELNPNYEIKTTLYNEKMFISVDNEFYGGSTDLINSDFSYKLIVQSSDYFDYETIKEYQNSFIEYLKYCVILVLTEVLKWGF